MNVLGFSANFIARYFGKNVSGLSGYEDMVAMFIGFVALSMLPYCQLHGGHIAVDVFIKSMPRIVQWVSHIISTIMMVIMALFLSYMLVLGVMEARADGTVTAVLGWPVWVFMAPGLVSCFLWVAASLMTLFNLPQIDQEKPFNGT